MSIDNNNENEENKEENEEENKDFGRIGPEIVGFKKHKKYSHGAIEIDEEGVTV